MNELPMKQLNVKPTTLQLEALEEIFVGPLVAQRLVSTLPQKCACRFCLFVLPLAAMNCVTLCARTSYTLRTARHGHRSERKCESASGPFWAPLGGG